MNQELIRRIIKKYGFEAATVLKCQSGYRNKVYPVTLTDRQTVSLVLYKNEQNIVQKIKRANAVSDYLAANGFPSRRTLGPVIKIHSDTLAKYACLYTYLPGYTIPWEAYTMDHIKLLGKTLGDMHQLLKPGPSFALPHIRQLNDGLLGRMRTYFLQPGVKTAMHLKLMVKINEVQLSRFNEAFAIADSLPGQQILHMDFVRGNILFADKPSGDLKFTVSGVLDFEKTTIGHPVYDIARTLAFLLVDCKYKTEGKVRKYFLDSGYNKRSLAEFAGHYELLEEILNFYLLHDFYKFLLHNPYEYLHQNAHYVRTRDMLIERKMLKYTKV